MKIFLSRLLSILTLAERRRLFMLAGFDLLMGVADIVFVVAMLLIVQVYTATGTTISIQYQYVLLTAKNPVLVTGIFLLLFCAKNITGVLLSKKQHKFVFAIASRLSDRNIIRYLKGTYRDYVHKDSSRNIRLISQVPIEFGTYMLTNFQQIIAQAILIVFTVAAILWYHPTLFVLLLVLLLPPVLLLGWLVKQQLKKMRGQIKINSEKVIKHLQEALSGFIESNIYNKHNFFAGRYNYYQQQMNGNIATLQTLQGVSARFFEVFALLGFFILIAISKFYGDKAPLNLLTISVFMAAAYKIIPGMVKILNSAGQMKTYSFLLADLLEHHHPAVIIDEIPPDEAITTIQFSDVYFKYNEHELLNGLTFDIKPGDLIGLSGISGRGKTTVVNLLLGFLQPDEGSIIINQNNIVERQQYWPRVAYVKQQDFFINDSILKNITLDDDGYNEARLKLALKLTGLDVILDGEATGANWQINEHGKNLSGGQRQRLALARALYRDFDLLILDEPFSEMDHAAEQQILQQLKQHYADKMIILITHNNATLTFCTKIISPYAVQA